MSAPPVQQPLPFHFQFLAGAVAGVTEILCMYPLDVVKTRAQLNTGANTGIIQSFKDIIKKEGPATLYRGIAAPILVEAPKRATKFAANEQYTALYKKMFGLEKVTQPLAVATGVSAGITEAILIVPFELIKIRMIDPRNAAKYSGTMDALSKIIKQEGPFALYNGLEATMWRHAIWNGGYFGTIFMIKDLLPKAENKSEQLRNNFIAGTVGGTFGTILNNPLDVVKSRIQGYTGEGPKKYNWSIPSLAIIAKEEGMATLYRGFTAKVLRLGPGGGVLLVVFESVSNFLRKNFMDKQTI